MNGRRHVEVVALPTLSRKLDPSVRPVTETAPTLVAGLVARPANGGPPPRPPTSGVARPVTPRRQVIANGVGPLPHRPRAPGLDPVPRRVRPRRVTLVAGRLVADVAPTMAVNKDHVRPPEMGRRVSRPVLVEIGLKTVRGLVTRVGRVARFPRPVRRRRRPSRVGVVGTSPAAAVAVVDTVVADDVLQTPPGLDLHIGPPPEPPPSPIPLPQAEKVAILAVPYGHHGIGTTVARAIVLADPGVALVDLLVVDGRRRAALARPEPAVETVTRQTAVNNVARVAGVAKVGLDLAVAPPETPDDTPRPARQA